MELIFWKWVLETVSMEFKNGWEGKMKEREGSMTTEVST